MDSTWTIIQIIERYNRRAEQVVKYSPEGEALRELYAQNLRLQFKTEYGSVLAVDDFIHWVEEGWTEDDDGVGHWCNWDGNMADYIKCNAEWLQKHRENYPFIVWRRR